MNSNHTNSVVNLEINYPLNTKNKNVRVVVFIEDESEEEEEEEEEEKLWLQSINSNPAFDFLKEEKEVYNLNDGKPLNDEK